MEKNQLADRIRAFRKLKGFTQQQLADQLDVSIAVLGSIERGSRSPNAKVLSQIASVLNIELSELVPLAGKDSGGVKD